MRIAGVSTIEQANKVLADFLPRFNARFGVPAAQPGSAYRQPPSGVCLGAVLCFKYVRTMASDNTVRFNGSTLQLMADESRASYARANVEVQEQLDDSIVVAYRGKTLATEPAPSGPVELRARIGRRYNGHLPDRPSRQATPVEHGTKASPNETPSDRTTRPAKPKPRSRPNPPNHPWKGPFRKPY